MGAVFHVYPGALAFGVNQPDGRDAEIEVIVFSRTSAARSSGESTSTAISGRRCDDAASGATASENDYVGITEAGGPDLNTDLDSNPKCACMEEDVGVRMALCVAMTDFSYITLHYTSVDVLAVGFRAVA